VAWITPQHEAGSVAYLWCVVQRFPKNGRVLAVKGDTYKQKATAVEYRERDDGSVAETRILTDKFVPVIRAWDLSPNSDSFGRIITIH
ncbi:hypothetical protein ABQW53_11780, partial [Xanthomonas hortorum pv. hederae]